LSALVYGILIGGKKEAKFRHILSSNSLIEIRDVVFTNSVLQKHDKKLNLFAPPPKEQNPSPTKLGMVTGALNIPAPPTHFRIQHTVFVPFNPITLETAKQSTKI